MIFADVDRSCSTVLGHFTAAKALIGKEMRAIGTLLGAFQLISLSKIGEIANLLKQVKLLIFLLRNFSFSFVKLCRNKINPAHALSELIDNCTDGICIIEVMIALSLPNILDPFFNRCQSVFCSSFVISGLINEGIRPL